MADFILTIVVEVVKCLAPPAYRQISYLRESKYTSNLQNLKTEVEKLKSERVRTEHQVDEAERNGEEIEENVRSWLEGANKVIEEADKFTEDEAAATKRCFKGLCPNLKTRRRLSKEAERKKEAVVKVREDRRFDRISYRTAPEDIRLIPSKDYEPFESRMSTLMSILSALEDRDVNMLGIYGMGGIGKTTLAEEVARKVKSDKLFDQVVFVEVSQNQDIRKIQGVIADKLGLKLHEESDEGRAGRLCEGIKKVKKILIVLDNIWENLNLGNVRIPLGDGCKVLLTARSLNVLSEKMDCRTNFPVGVLNEEEAWSLFKKMAGDYVEGSELEEVARNVAEECAGLPVSIVTVARALRSNSIREWKDALEQLRRPSSSNFKDVQPAAFKAIELSYNKLGRDDLKNIFLLIGYTAISSIDDLLMCGMGLGLFQGVNKIEVARNRVHTLVRTLKASCMLLDHISQEKELFSMHDVVRDVAVSIASTERNVFTATNEQVDGCREWSDGSAIKHCTSIVLHDIKPNLLPEVLECPQLELLFLSNDPWESSRVTIPDNFFKSMIEVRVVNLTDMVLPSSLGLLSNLRTLSLCRCSLPDISFVVDLKKNLEILCLRGSDIKQMPTEVGELTWLKLLDLRDCEELEVIPPNILSKLSRLEELYIGESFDKWEVEVEEGVKNASLEELKHLPNLTSLKLHVYDVSTLPRGLLLEKLERYIIRIGDVGYWESTGIWYREFSLQLNNNICLKDSLIVQLQRIEDLELRGLQEQDVDYFRNVGSSHLKRLEMWGSDLTLSPAESERQEESTNDLRSHEIILEDNVQISNTLFAEKVRLPELEKLTLGSINVERIWLNQVTVKSCGIQNLTHLTLFGCMNLRCLFSSSTVSSFVRLQRIDISVCPVLEELIVVDNQEEMKNNIVTFPQLQYLKMYDLKKFTSFCTGDLDILEFPSLKELRIFHCPEFMMRYKRTTSIFTERVFPMLEELKVDAKYIGTNKYLFSEDLLCKLKYLYMELVDERTILSLGDFLQRLHTMKVLQIGGGSYTWLPKEKVENGMGVNVREANDCYHLEHILIQESSVTNNLVILHVKWCDHLVDLVPPSTSFQNLTNLVVSCCKRLKIVLTSSIAKTLVRLRYMEIQSCDRITEIVLVDDVVAKDEVITFRELKKLKLLGLQGLTSFCSGNCAFKFPSLERLVVDDCPDMKIFSEGKLSTPKLHKVQGRGKACWAWKDDLNTTIRKASLPGMVAGVWSDDSGLQLEATTQFSKLLSIARSPQIDKVIQSGVVQRFVEFLMREDYPQLQYEAAWALSNIASGTSENIKVVIDHGAVPIFVKLLASPSDDVREQAVWALGNVAGDSSGCRDLVLSEGALIPLLAELNEHAKLSMLRIAARTLYNLCKGKPGPPFDQVRAALPALAQLIHLDDEEVLSDACWTLSYLSDGTNDKIQAVIEAGVCPRLVELLGHPSSSVLAPALRTVGNIVMGDDFQTQYIINCDPLPYFLGLLIHDHEESLKKDACRTISNITAGNGEQIQAVIDSGLIGPIVNLLQNAEFDAKKEAAWAISNATKFGTHEQIKHLVRKGCVKPLCDLLLCADPKIVTVCLEGLEDILKVGVAEMNTGTAVGDFNQYAQLVEEAEGLEKIENLRSHDDNGISEKAVEILETYWSSRVIGRGR
ncbi:putative disease resistance protein [Citrus sinensis]|nr:putative disease resistance protein [Citrus sinensis]